MTKFGNLTLEDLGSEHPGSWGAPGGLLLQIADESGRALAKIDIQFDIVPETSRDYRGGFRVDVEAFGNICTDDFALLTEVFAIVRANQGDGEFYTDAFYEEGIQDEHGMPIPRKLPFPNAHGGLF